MEKVDGIGGVFFRAKDPEALSQWYSDHLGVSPVPVSYEVAPWFQKSGPSVFAPFEEKTDYFGSLDQKWMINFREKNLELIVEQLKACGIEVKIDPEKYPNGRFARLHDPEGNPIKLWQPT